MPSRALNVLLIALLSGCATLGGSSGRPSAWNRLGEAVRRSAHEPATWAPAAAALALHTTRSDAKIGRWATSRTPVFGSTPAAERASDRLLDASEIFWLSSLFLSRPVPGHESAIQRATAGAVGMAVLRANGAVTDALKRTAGRRRPDDSDALSFPSGHSSSASVRATLASRRIADGLSMPQGRLRHLQPAVTLLAAGMAAGCGWARVEAGRHYPTDVLAGLALGHFIGAVADESFLTSPDSVPPLRFAILPQPGGVQVRATWALMAEP